MKNISKILTMAMLVMFFAFLGGTAAEYVTGAGDALAAACDFKGGTGDALKPGDLKCDDINTLNDRIYGMAKVIAGIVLGFAVLMIVYAGFKYTTSQGDPKVTEQAKMQIISAGIGIGIAMLAFVIVKIFEGLM